MENNYDGLETQARPDSPLSHEVMMQLVSNLGNDETKLITLAGMSNGVHYGQRPLAKRIEGFLGGLPSPYVGKSNYATYCEKSFQPAGLVDVFEVDRDGKLIPEYTLTPFGAQVGVSFAGHLLEFSMSHPEVSLQELSGSTKSSAVEENTGIKKTAPELRFKIYFELLTADLPIRIADLSRALDTSPSILKRHLEDLDSADILQYRSADSLGPVVEYRINPEKSMLNDPPHQYPELTKDIMTAVHSLTENDAHRWISVNDIAETIPMRTTGSYKGSEGLDSTRSVILKRLADEGYLLRKDYDGLSRSTINMSQEQRNTLLEFITIIDTFRNQRSTYIAEGLHKAKQILTTPEAVHTLMTKAKENSPNAGQLPVEEMKHMILGIFPDTNEYEAKDLLGLLKDSTGKTLGRVHLNQLLRSLVEAGTIRVREENNRKYWSLKNI